ncbi:MAG TPA: TIGR01777 family oxidoreductase [Chloroflexota bacterium]|nr:TIGR01777 family oxidoreductase [Chloroflexota bacterium]
MSDRRVVVAGASGLIGSALVPALRADGWQVSRLVRRTVLQQDEIGWDPASGQLDATALAGCAAVIHLGGVSISTGRWTAARKRAMHESRVASTALLAGAIGRLANPPSAFIGASAIGWYGNRGDELLTEASGPGAGFLATLCGDWEAAASGASQAGVRVLHARLGLVLSQSGGAMARLLPLFRAGLGGRLGSGLQWWSWVTLADVVGVLLHLVRTNTVSGPVNVVSPRPVTNAEFSRQLARVLRRPSLLPAPAPLLRLALGGMADELLLASQRVSPTMLRDSGYAFQYPELDAALRWLTD